MADKNMLNNSKLASLVSVHTFTNGEATVNVTGTNGTLALHISAEGPRIAVLDFKRKGKRVSYKAFVSLEANGRLSGYFVDRKGATPEEDTIVFFPTEAGTRRVKSARKATR
jgi:hypothetical protein